VTVILTIVQALEHYEDLVDIKRIIVHATTFPVEVGYLDSQLVSDTNDYS